MAFLRFSRDKRGYEHFYLVEPIHRSGKPVTRVLYWFRTPPNVKVGREPFAEEVRSELESRYPDVAFDWRRILETPIPSADTERWRERRRAERAARAAPQSPTQEAVGDELDIDAESAADEEPADAPIHVIDAAAAAASETNLSTANDIPDAGDRPGLEASAASSANSGEFGGRRRRRRRRRRRNRAAS